MYYLCSIHRIKMFVCKIVITKFRFLVPTCFHGVNILFVMNIQVGGKIRVAILHIVNYILLDQQISER